MNQFLSYLIILILFPSAFNAQNVVDDFEGNGTITNWFGDDCAINTSFANPYKNNSNPSSTVLRYEDNGGQYANARFEINQNFNLSGNYIFTIKIYVPSSGITGNQKNQISLKLQNGKLGEPWSTQSEVIKAIQLNEWQTVTFNFKDDPYINLDGGSPAPIVRKDFNRIVIQVNGENNNDKVTAFMDDFFYNGVIVPDPVYDQLIWSDEFDTDGPIDQTKWFHQTRLPNNGSWYNGEIQHYTNRTSNSYVDDGFLNIVAKKENFSDQGVSKQYTSARLNSKFAFKYGKLECRAKLPFGVGTWPAIWMLGKNINEDGGYWDNQGFGTTSWPACGEIDIMEHWGYNQNYVQSALHTPSSFGNTVNIGGQRIPTVSSDFHVYSFVWTPEKLIFSVDSVVHYIYQPDIKDENTWPFDDEQYILLNVAIQQSIAPNFTQSPLVIDYVRLYQERVVSGTEDLDRHISYYPNPVTDELNLILDDLSDQDIDIQMYDTNGQKVYEQTHRVMNNKVIITSLDQLHKGMYILSYNTGQTIKSFKFIKN